MSTYTGSIKYKKHVSDRNKHQKEDICYISLKERITIILPQHKKISMKLKIVRNWTIYIEIGKEIEKNDVNREK